MEKKGRAELLLEGIKTRIQDAPSAPLHQEKCVLDRNELLKLLDNVSEVVITELNAYREVNDKRARIIKEAKEEAEEILYQAERTSSRIRVTKRGKNEPPAFRAGDLDSDEKKALRTASDIYAASLIYTDEMLTEVDHLVADCYEKIEQEYARMRSTLRQKIEDISENKAELMSSLTGLKANDRYAQILELSDLLSVELYNERVKAMAKEREEMAQMRLTLNEDGEADVKVESARPPISPDRTARKIEQAKSKMDIDVMDRSNEVSDQKEDTGIRKVGRKINKKTGKVEDIKIDNTKEEKSEIDNINTYDTDSEEIQPDSKKTEATKIEDNTGDVATADTIRVDVSKYAGSIVEKKKR